MPPEKVKIRNDLIISRQETAGDTIFVLKDPATRRFFRFHEAEYFIIQQLDGATSFDVIQERVEDKYGASLSQEMLTQFVKKLDLSGLLEAKNHEVKPSPQHSQRVRGNLLYLRFKTFNPDRLFDRMISSIRWIFTTPFITISAFFILLALGIVTTNGNEIGQDLWSLWRFDAVLLTWLTILLITITHEFAHGLTCKHFGGQVYEMGFMFIYFQPALYCNVSDAWLFPQKSRRLWVTFAGVYFELCVWALAIVTWRVAAPETLFHFMALVVMASTGIKIFFNLNPLIKLDGYYLLSDFLAIPNLRQRAIGYLKACIKRPWGTATVDIGDVTIRERWIYLIYGLLAGTFSFFFLGFIFWHFGDYLIGQFQGPGFIMLLGLMAMAFHKPLKNTMPKPPALFESIREKYGGFKRSTKLLLILILMLPVLFFGRMELTVSGEFEIYPNHNADIRAQVHGVIEFIYVNEGDSVGIGDPVVHLSDREYRADLRRIEAEIGESRILVGQALETARIRYKYAKRWSEEAAQMHTEKLTGVKISVEKAQERLNYSQNALDRARSLLERALIAREEYEVTTEQVGLRQKELEAAQSALKMVQANDLAEVRKMVMDAGQAVKEAESKYNLLMAGDQREVVNADNENIARLEAQRRYLVEQIERLEHKSPITGMVTTFNLKEKIGQYVRKGDLIAEVHEMKTILARIPVSEKEIADVAIGQTVELKARAYSQRSFYGQITAIAPTATRDHMRNISTILITTHLDNAMLLLKPEMTGNAKIYCGKRRIIDLITRRMIRFIRVEFWSWW